MDTKTAAFGGTMIFAGDAIEVEMLDEGIARLKFDLKGESVNKFNRKVSSELSQVLDLLESHQGIRGLLLTSGKKVFFVGADIAEFLPAFALGEEAIAAYINANNRNFNRLEDLPFPTVVAINGYALGGGLEVCLACDYRVMSPEAKVGLPETKLGLMPGWGGTVRLPRIAGLDVAVEWIAGGAEHSAEAAFKAGVVDGVVAEDQLQEAALGVLREAIAGKLPVTSRRDQKKSALRHNDMESLLGFESSKMFVGAKAGKNYPAPVKAIKVMQEGAKLSREPAQVLETAGFVKLAQTSAAKNLVGLFLNDQLLTKKAKLWEKQASAPVAVAAVLGAGIMGGGIAYQSATKGVPIKMKDIAQSGLDLGIKEATKLMSKRLDSGRISAAEMVTTLKRIQPTLSYEGFEQVDLVVEAVVENPKIKKSVLQEVESKVGAHAILCSNTSTISIDLLAEGLQRPANFCGMHFFNPVHQMPLVEVIRGTQTSDQAVARTVAYANALGKKAIVVNNCPGFLVNRVLFPYLAGFSMLVRDGADFQAIDKVMETWGWPMGPAYLLDVVGLDTGVHAESVMAQGYPDRMSKSFKAATDILFESGRYGQKNGKGFYVYQEDKKGKPVKLPSDETYGLLKPHVAEARLFADTEIIARMMIPMALEVVRCLEDKIVGSAAEADMALIYGLGFPPFRGGVLSWIDEMGLGEFVKLADQHQALGPLYQVTDGLRAMAANGQRYYQQETLA
jgi:3-hydroxyacyl-CoA dehydrogenase / enoyl-CoA hydratase / 3-hydroxybutyryl-CoA epimerase / enoyl-CoA isomerase